MRRASPACSCRHAVACLVVKACGDAAVEFVEIHGLDAVALRKEVPNQDDNVGGQP